MPSQHEILVSLASKHNTVPYDLLMNALNISKEREFEEFVIQAIYQDIIQGRLNPVNRQLEIYDWTSEKLGESDLQFMANTLKHWDKHCGTFLNSVGNEIDRSNLMLTEMAANEKAVVEETDNIRRFLHDESRKIYFDRDGPKISSKPEAKKFKGMMKSKRSGN